MGSGYQTSATVEFIITIAGSPSHLGPPPHAPPTPPQGLLAPACREGKRSLRDGLSQLIWCHLAPGTSDTSSSHCQGLREKSCVLSWSVSTSLSRCPHVWEFSCRWLGWFSFTPPSSLSCRPLHLPRCGHASVGPPALFPGGRCFDWLCSHQGGLVGASLPCSPRPVVPPPLEVKSGHWCPNPPPPAPMFRAQRSWNPLSPRAREGSKMGKGRS